MVESPLAMQETQIRSLSQEDPLEKEMSIHSSILAWKIPWTQASLSISESLFSPPKREMIIL